MVIKIGVLELQGNFALHHNVLSKLEIESLSVKHKKDLNRVNGLIIPGGESTTISLLIDSFKLRSHLIEFSKSNPIMGTCAGLILMAKNVPDKRVNPLGLLNINIERNAYGRQIMSRTECLNFKFNKKINFDLENSIKWLLILNESIRSEMVVDSPPGIIKPSTFLRSFLYLTDRDSISNFDKTLWCRAKFPCNSKTPILITNPFLEVYLLVQFH